MLAIRKLGSPPVTSPIEKKQEQVHSSDIALCSELTGQGGYCSSLKVSCLRDRVFSFNVSCKAVGFLIYLQKLTASSISKYKTFPSLP